MIDPALANEVLDMIAIILGMMTVNAAFGASIPPLTSQFNKGILEITPPEGHHFNEKAPAEARFGQSSLPLQIDTGRILVSLNPSTLGKTIRTSAYVCDNAKTFCLKKPQSFAVPASLALKTEERHTKLVFSRNSGKPARPHLDEATDFWVNDPSKAFELAASKKLPLLIDFFGIWCPPCNHLDGVVFKSKKFKKETQGRIVKLKLDADNDAYNDLKNKYHIQALPTVVFTTPQGDEITRLVGYRTESEFIAAARLSYENRMEGYAQLIVQADAGNADARYQAAKIALDRDEPQLAQRWLEPYAELFLRLHDPRLEDLLRARLGIAQSNRDIAETRKIIVEWAKLFPRSVRTFENLQTLADLEEESGNVNESRDALSKAAALSETFFAQPSLLKGSYYTQADIAQTRGDLYDRLQDKARAKGAYLACADAYSKEAADEDTSFARGPNLEKAYCLGKAGKVAESEAIYREGIRRFPNEYTFHAGLAKLLVEPGRDAKGALLAAERALEFAYGNQRLKAAMTKVRALEELGDLKSSLHAIESELASPLVQPPLTSTLRLRKQLEARKTALERKISQTPAGA